MNFIRRWNHARIDAGKAFTLGVARKLFGSRYHSRAGQWSIEQAPLFQKILILRLDDKIGDMAVNTLLFRELKKINPHATIDVFCGPNTQPLIENNPYISHIIFYKKGFLNTLSIALQLKKNNYDVLINIRELSDAKTIYLLDQIPHRLSIGFTNDHDYVISQLYQKKHITEKYADILTLLGAHQPFLNYDLHLSPADTRWAEESLKEINFQKLILINPYSAARYRNISLEKIAQMIQWMNLNNQYTFILIGPPSTAEKLQTLIQTHSLKNTYYFSDLKTIRQSAALIAKADLVITPDTSIVHIASAFDRPQIAFYRDDRKENIQNSIQWAPQSKNHWIIYAAGQSQGEIDINTFHMKDFEKAFRSWEKLIYGQ